MSKPPPPERGPGEDAAATSEALSHVSEAIESEQLAAEPDQVAFIAGAIAALDAVSQNQTSETPPSRPRKRSR